MTAGKMAVELRTMTEEADRMLTWSTLTPDARRAVAELANALELATIAARCAAAYIGEAAPADAAPVLADRPEVPAHE